MLPKLHLLEPIWSAPTIHRESVLFVKEGGAKTANARLLFPPREILSVQSADGATVFEPGRDFQSVGSDGMIELTTESRIGQLAEAELFPPKDAPRSIAAKTNDPTRYVLFDNGHWFHDQQVEITYRRTPGAWPGNIPAFAGGQLPKTLERLRKRQRLVIGLSGDSISQGYNASAFSQASPWMPAYGELVAAQLRASYGGEVVFHNRAIAGWSVNQGLADLDALLATDPDLIIIAYGMNDVGRRDPDAFRQGIATMLERIGRAPRKPEVILVSPMLGNAQWRHTPREMFPRYRDALASLVGPSVALADLTGIWQVMLERKREVDLTGNGVNHPNDFGHRVYAQAILALLVESQTPAP